LSARFAPTMSGVLRPPLPNCRVEFRMSHLVLQLAGLAMERIRFSPSGRGCYAWPRRTAWLCDGCFQSRMRRDLTCGQRCS
jgi:hypothetical protein